MIGDKNPFVAEYNYQHGRIYVTLEDEKTKGSASIKLSFGAISEARSQVTLNLVNSLDWADRLNDPHSIMILSPAEHMFQVNYPSGKFDEATLRIENSWRNGEFMNQFNAHVSAKDNQYEFSADNINSFDGEQNTIEFDAEMQIESNAYDFGSALNYNNDAVYDANAQIYAADNGDSASVDFTIRTMEDHFFQTSFNYQLKQRSNFVDTEMELGLRVQVDQMLPVQFAFEKNHFFQPGHVLGANLEFGDFRSQLGVQSIAIGVDSSRGDLSMTIVVDDHQGTIGIADVVDVEFNADSFKTGIRFYIDLPDFIDFNSGKMELVITYKEPNYGFVISNAVAAQLHLDDDSVKLVMTNYMSETALPAGEITFALAEGEVSVSFYDNSVRQTATITYAEFSGAFEYTIGNNNNDDVYHRFEVNVDWEDDIRVSISNNEPSKPLELNFDQRTASKVVKNIMSVKPVFIMTKTDSLLRSTLGIQYNKVKYVVLGELVLNDNSVTLRFATREGDAEMEKLFTFEAGVTEAYDIEFFVSYHDALHRILQIEPVSIINQAKLKIRSLLTTANQLATALNNGFNQNDQINSIDEIQAFMVDVFQTIDEWINTIEELAPQQAINGDNITVGDLITNSVGLTRAELDEVIQNARNMITESIMASVDQALNAQEQQFKGTQIGRDFFEVYSKALRFVAQQTSDYVLSCLNIVTSNSRSFVLVEENNIFITIPLPDIRLPGMQTSLVEFLTESDIESAMYKMAAAFGDKHSNRASTELEAEILGPYVRQFDGKWIQLVDHASVDHAQIMAISDPNKLIRDIQMDENNHILYADMYMSRNKDHGVFGFPDSEVYSDNLDHLQDTGKW